MNVLYLTIPLSLILGGVFLTFFIMSVRDGQFDELEKHKTKIFDVAFKKDGNEDERSID